MKLIYPVDKYWEGIIRNILDPNQGRGNIIFDVDEAIVLLAKEIENKPAIYQVNQINGSFKPKR